MKIIFAGTPQFAATALESLLARQYNVVAVLTQPDRRAGRGMQFTPSAVKQLALQHGLPVLQPASLKEDGIQSKLAEYAAEVMVVAAYGLILPLAVLQLPRYGCLNIHASLLPRWRGAAPIQRAILAGDSETGITIMQMDAGLDTGDMLLKKSCLISAGDNAQTLLAKLAALGAEAIGEVLHALQQNQLQRIPQNSAQASYAAKLDKHEARINWAESSENIYNAIRAYNPFPGASATLKSVPIKIWQSSICEKTNTNGEAGTILSVAKDGIIVACGKGALNLEILQRPGAKALPAVQFVQGFPLSPGERFTSPSNP
jgi:methionyl-tRNA formyltransferase